MAPFGDEGGIHYFTAAIDLGLRETEIKTKTKTETKIKITTDNRSASCLKNFSQHQQSKEPLTALSQQLSELTLAPLRPQEGQFGFYPENKLPTTFLLLPTMFSPPILSPSPSTLSPSPTNSSDSLWNQLPQYNTPATSPPFYQLLQSHQTTKTCLNQYSFMVMGIPMTWCPVTI